jgi:hypothetical protein
MPHGRLKICQRLGRLLETVIRKLGGRQALGQEVTSEANLARVVSRRIPLKALMHIKRSGFSDREIERFIIPARTRRIAKVEKSPLIRKALRFQAGGSVIAMTVSSRLVKANNDRNVEK